MTAARAGAIGLVLVLLTAMVLMDRSWSSGSGAPDAAVLDRPAASASAPAPQLGEGAAPPSGVATRVSGPAAAATAVEPPTSPVSRLVARLREIVETEPAAFHERATDELIAFVTTHPRAADATWVDDVLARLDDDVREPRVRGALHVVLGAWGEQALLLERCARRGEAWRSAIVGMCWDADGDAEGAVVELHPLAFLEREPRDGHTVLGLPLDRPPDDALVDALIPLARATADDAASLLDRELAIFALGTGLDARPEILSLFASMLFDMSPATSQVHAALCFALAHARGDDARALLLAFLEDPRTAMDEHPLLGDTTKQLATWWMSRRASGAETIAAVSRPLRDPDAAWTDRIAAIDGLVNLARAEPTREEQESIAAALIAHLDREQEHGAMLATLAALGYCSGAGWGRLTALEGALRDPEDASVRMWAAHGVASTEPPLDTAAAGLLRAALEVETDPRVLEVLRGALAADG